jgi:hypothetical protein
MNAVTLDSSRTQSIVVKHIAGTWCPLTDFTTDGEKPTVTATGNSIHRQLWEALLLLWEDG